MELPKQFFVAGTDTDVGKTVVSALLTLGLGADYWKPVQSGMPTDRHWLTGNAQIPEERLHPETYRFSEPLSVHRASQIDGKEVHLKAFQVPTANPLVVEGAGGLLHPLNASDYVVDLIRHLELPVLLVARSGLGTINHTLMSLEVLRARSCSILGVIVNGPKNWSNVEAIERYGKIPVLGQLEPLEDLNRESLLDAYRRLA